MEEMATTHVSLPPSVGERIEVYVNGVRQREGEDYVRVPGGLLFSRPLAREGRLGFWRWLSLFLGIAGTYRRHDSVDVVYEVGGRRLVAADLPMTSVAPEAPAARTGEP